MVTRNLTMLSRVSKAGKLYFACAATGVPSSFWIVCVSAVTCAASCLPKSVAYCCSSPVSLPLATICWYMFDSRCSSVSA